MLPPSRSAAVPVARPTGAEGADIPGAVASQSSVVSTLKTRAEFQRVRGGGRAEKPAFLLEGKRRQPAKADAPVDSPPGNPMGATVEVCDDSGPRFGFTITKKLGGAVVRNRIRRRLKAALRELAGRHARSDMDYVVVARRPAYDQDFAGLTADLAAALDRVSFLEASHHQKSRRTEGRTKR